MTNIAARKILFLNHSAQLGGAELSLLDVMQPYAATCKLLTFTHGALLERARTQGIECRSLDQSFDFVTRDSTFVNPLRLAGKLVALISQVIRASAGYEAIYTNTLKASVVGMVAAKICKRPVIVHLRDILSREHFSQSNIKFFVTLTNNCASRVIANSKATAAAFVAAGGRPQLVEVVYNGIAAGTAGGATSLGFPESDFVIGCFSRISAWKGQDVLIEAVARAKTSIRLILVGAPLFNEESYEQRLKLLCEKLGISDRVAFLGFVPDPISYMQTADLIVHPSVAAEPFGRTIVEAMMLGKTVVAANNGAAPELIRHNETGFLVAPGNVEELAATITRCAEDLELRQRIGAAAKADASARFSLDRLHSEIDRVLAGIL